MWSTCSRTRVFAREQLHETELTPTPGDHRVLADMRMGSMLHRDPPDHKRLRGLVSQTFTPMMVQRLRSNVEQIFDGLLDLIEERREAGWIAEFAMPVPVMVISDMLGVPKQDRDLVKHWSYVLAGLLEPGVDPGQINKGTQAGMEFIRYLQEIYADRRKQPQSDSFPRSCR